MIEDEGDLKKWLKQLKKYTIISDLNGYNPVHKIDNNT